MGFLLVNVVLLQIQIILRKILAFSKILQMLLSKKRKINKKSPILIPLKIEENYISLNFERKSIFKGFSLKNQVVNYKEIEQKLKNEEKIFEKSVIQKIKHDKSKENIFHSEKKKFKECIFNNFLGSNNLKIHEQKIKNFNWIKKKSLNENSEISKQLNEIYLIIGGNFPNFCFKRKCSCLKYKNKKKFSFLPTQLPTVFENLAY